MLQEVASALEALGHFAGAQPVKLISAAATTVAGVEVGRSKRTLGFLYRSFFGRNESIA